MRGLARVRAARGGRSDELIEQAARIAARGFGRLVVKEDKDLRGRRPGEVAAIIRRVVADEAPRLDCSVVLCEEDALRRELKSLGGEEIVVMFYDKLDPLKRVLAAFGAEPVETIEGLAPRGEARGRGRRRPVRAARHEGRAPRRRPPPPRARPSGLHLGMNVKW